VIKLLNDTLVIKFDVRNVEEHEKQSRAFGRGVHLFRAVLVLSMVSPSRFKSLEAGKSRTPQATTTARGSLRLLCRLIVMHPIDSHLCQSLDPEAHKTVWRLRCLPFTMCYLLALSLQAGKSREMKLTYAMTDF
jgi:hypothetical protein